MRLPRSPFGAVLAVLAATLIPSAPVAAETPHSVNSLGWTIAASPLGEVTSAAVLRENDQWAVQTAAPGGQFGPFVPLWPRANYGPEVMVAGPHGETITWWVSGGHGYRAVTSFRAPGGTFDPPVTLTRGYPGRSGVDLAFDGAGNVTAVWGVAREGVRVRTRRASGRWSPASLIPAARAYDPRLAVASDGAATVVWSERVTRGGPTRVMAAERPAGGSFGPPHQLVRTDRDVQGVVVATNDAGDAVALWSETVEATFRTSLHAAFRRRGAASFGSATTLTHARDEPSGESVSIAPDGRVVFGWRDNTRLLAEARIRTAAGVLLPVQVLSRDLLENSAATALALGDGLVAWYDGHTWPDGRQRGPVFLRTATASPAGRFGAPRTRWTTRRLMPDEPWAFATDAGLLLVTGSGRILRP
jgi:hypothetical protein